MNFDSNTLDALLKVVGGKLGMQPSDLKQQLESGKFDSALKNMNTADAAKFQQVVQNPKLMEQFMSSSQAQALYKKLTGEK